MLLWPDQSLIAEWAEQNVFDPEASTDVGQFHRQRDFATYVKANWEHDSASVKTSTQCIWVEPVEQDGG